MAVKTVTAIDFDLHNNFLPSLSGDSYAFLVYVELIYVFIAVLQSKIWVRCVKTKTEKIYNPKWNQRRLREMKRLCFSVFKGKTFVAQTVTVKS
jgi:hypothetical protein